jgi:hypothetical protein
MTPQQRDALKQALEQHSLSMAVKDAAPEDVAALPQDFAVPTYNANNQPLYDNQLFPAVKSVDDLVARGYATPDGQVTESGQMALSLKKVGALNDDYTLNDTGRAVLSKREDLLEPENLNLYGKAEELNLDDDGRGMGERFSAGVKELWKSTQDLGAALYEEAEPIVNVVSEVISTPEQQILRGQKEVGDISENVSKAFRTPEQKAATRIRTEEAIKEFSDQSVATLLGAGELIARATAAGPFPIAQRQLMALTNAANKDEAVLITRQARERILNDVANVGVAEAVDQLTGVTEFVKSYQQAAELLGPEATQEKIAQGKAMGLAGSVLNPATPEAAAFGAAFKVARGVTAPISGAFLRSEQKAQRMLSKTQDLTALQKQAAEYQLTVKAIEQQAARAEDTAAKLSQRGFVDRANSATTTANALRRKAQEASVRFGGLQDEITRVSDDLATLTKDATVADKFNQMMQKAKEVPYMPITMVGSTLEYVGRNMIGIDKGLSKLASKIGVDKAYNAMNKISSLSGLGTVGAAAGLGPAAFIPAAIKTAWSTAPFIEGAGKFINLVGKEAMKSRADIGFWKRIYAMPNQGPVNRAIAGLMDTATLGGRVTDLGVRTTKGVLAAVPADLAFQYVAEGGKMDAGSIGEALSESLFFGGAGGGLGAITMGSKQKIRSLQNGNAINFYRTLDDPQQRVMFNGMPDDYRRAIGTFSATNPGARVMFTTIGGGGIDPNTNTIYINPNSSNPIKPLVTHEFMHHMMNNGIGEGIVAQLVGDGYQTGGILRTADGKYEPQYEAFKEEYVDRLRQQHAQMIKMREAIGDKIPANEREFQAPSEKYLAEEYFIESNVEDMLGLVESGKFGKMAGRMIINDKVRALGDSILNKSSILRDLHFKLGGVMDKNGKMVSGNGFLGGQMYQSPEIRRMFKKMVSDSVGRKGGFDQARVKAKEGVKLKINSKSDPILKSMVSLWESDADGVPFLDKDGDFVPLKKETEEMRATAGLLLIDDQNRRQANGETIAEGQLAYNPDTQTWSGKYLTEDQIRILRLSGRFNNPQIRQLEMLNEAAKATLDPNAAPETRGNRFSIIYQAALGRNKKGKWRYDQIEPSLRDVVPYGVEITKKGNILIRIMSTNQMHANISKKAASKKGVQLYEGNIEAMLRDVNKVIELHGEADGKPTDAHFKEKHGAAWESHKAFINSVFGNVGAGHKDINPLVASDKVDAVVKTYRLDRINKATQMVGSTNLPYQNNLVKINYLPEGEPILDENGEPKDLRYTPSYEDSQVRMPEAQRAMPEGEQGGDVTLTRLREIRDGLEENLTEREAIDELDFIINDAPSGYFPQDILNKVDQAKRDLEEEFTTWAGRGDSEASTESAISSVMSFLDSKESRGEAAPTRFMPEGVDEDKFYSQLERVITDKVPTRATAQQIMATIDPTRGSGVKADEIKWSGIEQALASLEKDGKVSKEDLLNYLRNEGRVRFEEVVRKQPSGIAPEPQLPPNVQVEEINGDWYITNPIEDEGPFATEEEATARMMNPNAGYLTTETAIIGQNPLDQTRFSQYVLPGGENYREVVLAMPKTSGYTLRNGRGDIVGTYKNREEALVELKQLKDSDYLANITPTDEVSGYTSSHFPDIPNYVAHMRTNERTLDDGSEGLFVEEFQSDRHQAGRKKGYAGEDSGEIPDAPFRTTWPIQLFKRALRDAVDGGKDWIGWTTGETQNDRFDLSKQVDSVNYDPLNKRLVAVKDGNRVIDESGISQEKLVDYVGKDIADKLIQPNTLNGAGNHVLSGNNLKVGGSGMKGFYDNMLPKEVGKYVKQFGGKVEKADMTQSVEADIMSGEEAETGSIPIWKVNITPEMRKISQTGQMRFLPEPVEKLSAFKGKRVQVLTSDLSLVGDVKYGEYTASFKGGPGYLDNDGWAFTDKAAADAFVTRWKKDGEPLIGLASLGSANHLNSLDARKAYAEKWKYLVSTGEISEELANDHIKQAMKRIINSDSKNVKTDWRNAAKMIESADDLSNYFNKIPWAAAPMFYSKLTAKTLPIKYKKLVELGLDLETAAKEYRQPEFEGAELGDLYAIAEYDGSTPEHKPELNKAYPWRIKFKKKATLSEMHNVAKLTTDPRAFAKKKVGGRLGAQPLMVTGINLDKLLTGDITGSAKPLILREGTQKTKSNRAKQFGSGNPEAYRSYQQIQAERNTKKPKKKSTAKGDASAIANAAKLK